MSSSAGSASEFVCSEDFDNFTDDDTDDDALRPPLTSASEGEHEDHELREQAVKYGLHYPEENEYKCCNGGCQPCVSDLRRDELQRLEARVAAAKQRETSGEQCSLEVPADVFVVTFVPSALVTADGDALTQAKTTLASVLVPAGSTGAVNYAFLRQYKAKLLPIRSIRSLTADDACKSVLCLNIGLPKYSNIYPQCGDSVGVLHPNDEQVVLQLLRRLALDPCTRFRVEDKAKTLYFKNDCTSLFEALMFSLDIMAMPQKAFLVRMAEYCSDESDVSRLQHLVAPQGVREYRILRWSRAGLLEILYMVPSCLLSPSFLLQHIPPLRPRYFSVCNYPQGNGNQQLEIAFTQVDLSYRLERLPLQLQRTQQDRMSKGSPENMTRFLGRASSFMVRAAAEGWRIPLFLHSSSAFAPPEDPSRNVILIAAGTGITPFRSFLEARHHLQQTRRQEKPEQVQRNQIWLFYGCRHPAIDYLFREDLELYLHRGILTHLVTAFSCESPQKVYVQHRLLEYAEDIARLILDQDAMLYVCGSKYLVTEVEQSLLSILQNFGCKDAVSILEALKQSNCYRRDHWH